MQTEIRRAYLSVLRALLRTCRNDIDAQRQIRGAIRNSIDELISADVKTGEIVSDLDMTRQMLLQNIAQVSFNEKIDSYSVHIREEMLPKDGMTLDIKTPSEFVKEQECSINLNGLVSRHCNK